MNRSTIILSFFAMVTVQQSLPTPEAVAGTVTLANTLVNARPISTNEQQPQTAQAITSVKEEAASIAHELRKTIAEELAKARNSSFIRNHPYCSAAIAASAVGTGVATAFYFRKTLAPVYSGIGRVCKACHSFVTTMLYGSSIDQMANDVGALRTALTTSTTDSSGRFESLNTAIGQTRTDLGDRIQATTDRVGIVARDLATHAAATSESIAHTNAAIVTLREETATLQRTLTAHRTEMGDRAQALQSTIDAAAARLDALERHHTELQKTIADIPQNTVICLMAAIKKQRIQDMHTPAFLAAARSYLPSIIPLGTASRLRTPAQITDSADHEEDKSSDSENEDDK